MLTCSFCRCTDEENYGGRRGGRGKKKVERGVDHRAAFLQEFGGYGDGGAGLGARRARRFMNDQLLIDLAGPMTYEEMEGLFSPAPW